MDSMQLFLIYMIASFAVPILGLFACERAQRNQSKFYFSAAFASSLPLGVILIFFPSTAQKILNFFKSRFGGQINTEPMNDGFWANVLLGQMASFAVVTAAIIVVVCIMLFAALWLIALKGNINPR